MLIITREALSSNAACYSPAVEASGGNGTADASEAANMAATVSACTEGVRMLHARFTAESRRCRMLNNSLLDLKVCAASTCTGVQIVCGYPVRLGFEGSECMKLPCEGL